MLTNKEAISSFFGKHSDFLNATYPGISEKHLFRYINILPSSPYLKSQENELTKLFASMLEGIPLQHFSKREFFFKSEFYVTSDVLIPRAETEILVEDAVSLIKRNNFKSILDVGTGSGCIIISILQEIPYAMKAVATDLAYDALDIAKENYFQKQFSIHHDTRVSFVGTDRLDGIDDTFDIIVSNPPYIKKIKDISGVHPTVLKHEPEIALFINDSEYSNWFKELFVSVREHLNAGGFFIMEGHEHALHDLAMLARSLSFKGIIIKKDFNNLDRFLILRK